MKASNVTGIVTKRALIDKANTTTLVAAGVAAFLVVFSLVTAKSLISQLAYQNKVIGAKKTTLKQIKADLDARDGLTSAYNAFVGSPTNIIGGSSAGTGEHDGDNATLVLDALPSQYDFPALTASIEKLALGQGMKISGISGTDDEVAQSSQQTSAAPTPQQMTVDVSVDGAYAQLQNLILAFEHSIRPIQVQNMDIKATDSGLTTDISALTYYQPEKKLELMTKVLSQGKAAPAKKAAASATNSTSTSTSTTSTTKATQ